MAAAGFFLGRYFSRRRLAAAPPPQTETAPDSNAPAAAGFTLPMHFSLALPGPATDDPHEDPLDAYRVLSHQGFPDAACRRFRDRWMVQPVKQTSDGSQYFLIPAWANDDEALLWLVLGAKREGLYPVVPTPLAYKPRMLLSDGLLLAAAHGFFRIEKTEEARALFGEPAWVAQEDERTTFVRITYGRLYA